MTEMTEETAFFPRRKFNCNPEAIIQTRLLESDLSKFKAWAPTDKIELWPCGKNELILINHTILKERR